MPDDDSFLVVYDHLLKVVIIGESGVGKSSLLVCFCEGDFQETTQFTIGVDFKTKFISKGGKRLKIAMWDTAGQERFRTMTTSYYRNAQGVVLVYDCTDRHSFDNVNFWVDEVRRNCTYEDVVLMLVSNKVDLPKESHKVSFEEGKQLAAEQAMMFIETSAKTSTGVKQAFDEVVTKMLETPSLLRNTLPEGRNRQSKVALSTSSQETGCNC